MKELEDEVAKLKGGNALFNMEDSDEGILYILFSNIKKIKYNFFY